MSTTVTLGELGERLSRLEAELEMLKRDFSKFQDADKASRPYTFGDLAGAFPEFGGLSLEEMKEHEYRIPERRLRMFEEDPET
jgi:hypothetical protein